jgi:hypothetical protein
VNIKQQFYFSGTPTGHGQNIDEERKMRLNLQFMIGIKEGSWAYGKMQHGHQKKHQVITMAPVKGRQCQTNYNMEKEWLRSQLARFRPKT